MSVKADGERHQRLSVKINNESADVLRTVTLSRGISLTEAIRRAVGYLGLVEDLRERGSHVVLGDAQAQAPVPSDRLAKDAA